jgi:hypothetical protein
MMNPRILRNSTPCNWGFFAAYYSRANIGAALAALVI